MPSPTSRMTFLGLDASILAASCAVLSGPDWPTATPVGGSENRGREGGRLRLPHDQRDPVRTGPGRCCDRSVNVSARRARAARGRPRAAAAPGAAAVGAARRRRRSRARRSRLLDRRRAPNARSSALLHHVDVADVVRRAADPQLDARVAALRQPDPDRRVVAHAEDRLSDRVAEAGLDRARRRGRDRTRLRRRAVGDRRDVVADPDRRSVRRRTEDAHRHIAHRQPGVRQPVGVDVAEPAARCRAVGDLRQRAGGLRRGRVRLRARQRRCRRLRLRGAAAAAEHQHEEDRRPAHRRSMPPPARLAVNVM